MIDRINNEPVMVLAVVQAVLALVISFGLEVTPEQVGTITAVAAATLGLFARAQVSPVDA
jgi:hypothetical protein